MEQKLFVYVKMRIMMGDGDAYLTGTAVVPKIKWAKDMQKFKNYLLKTDSSEVERENYVFGMYYVSPRHWTDTPCTATEAEVLKKFLGEKSSEFCFPSEFTKKNKR